MRVVVCSDVNQMLSMGELDIAVGQTYHASWLHSHNFYPNKSTVSICFVFSLSVSAFLYSCAANTTKGMMNVVLCDISRY